MPIEMIILKAINIKPSLSINFDAATDIWWVILIAILGFFCCICCCLNCFFNMLNPWRYRRRGLTPPPRRGYIRWWRRYPPRTGVVHPPPVRPISPPPARRIPRFRPRLGGPPRRRFP